MKGCVIVDNKLIEKDDCGNWSVKGVPWFTITPGNVITNEIFEKIYSCLWKLMEYEDIDSSPAAIEKFIIENIPFR